RESPSDKNGFAMSTAAEGDDGSFPLETTSGGTARCARLFWVWIPCNVSNWTPTIFLTSSRSCLRTTKSAAAAPIAISKKPQNQRGAARLGSPWGFTLLLRTTPTLLWIASRRMRSLVSATSFSIGLGGYSPMLAQDWKLPDLSC